MIKKNKKKKAKIEYWQR